jgi:hypothetical protein
LTAVSKRTTDDIARRYDWLRNCPTSEIPYGGEPADFDYVRHHCRPNPIFQNDDGYIHITYAGTFNPGVAPVARAVFTAIRDGLREESSVFGRLRLHFVGTSYARDADLKPEVMPLIREFGLEELASEHPARLDYLTALSVVCDSHALLVLGNEQPHYTASKIFPYIMAERPLLAVFHEESNVVRILREVGGRQIETFSASQPPDTTAAAIAAWLRRLLANPADLQPTTDWNAFEQYTTRAMTGRLAQAFEDTLTRKAVERVAAQTRAAASP